VVRRFTRRDQPCQSADRFDLKQGLDKAMRDVLGEDEMLNPTADRKTASPDENGAEFGPKAKFVAARASWGGIVRIFGVFSDPRDAMMAAREEHEAACEYIQDRYDPVCIPIQFCSNAKQYLERNADRFSAERAGES
jgi:hypothetical protein